LEYVPGTFWAIVTRVAPFFSLLAAFRSSFLFVVIGGLRGELPTIVCKLVSAGFQAG